MSHFNHLRSGVLAIAGQPSARLAFARELAAKGEHKAAFRLFAKAAKAGLPTAFYELGQAYLLGRGVPCCLTEAMRWLNRAATAGDADAQRLLGSFALQGIDLDPSPGLFAANPARAERSPDYFRAFEWAALAAEGGSGPAKALLGFILTEGPAPIHDRAQGDDCYRQAAEAGDPQGQIGWAMVLLHRNTKESVTEARGLIEAAASAGLSAAHYLLGVLAENANAGDADLAAAAEHYGHAAELGHHAAQLRYGMALLTGRGIEQDAFNAETWLRRAALGGEAQAAAIVGDLYARAGRLPPNYFEASIWFRLAAEAGHTGAARALGQLYLRGDGVVRDPQEAAHWLRQAADQGDEGAMADLAPLALAGEASEADRKAIFAWFQRRSDAGDLAATFNVAICLAEGIGAQRDDARALASFRQAAKAIPMAQYWCGRMLSQGRGQPADTRAARACFLQAAAQANPDAEVAAGEMLINGRGGPADRNMAIVLFKRAAATGHRGGMLALELIRGMEANDDQCEQRLAA